MKRKLALLLAAIPAALMPLAAVGQAAQQTEPAPASPSSQSVLKYEVMVGYGYTSLNQLNQSRHGLQGVKIGAARDFGRSFAMIVNGDYFKPAFPGVAPANPGDPSVYSVLAGPEFRANIWEQLGGFVHGMIGVEHTGGEKMTPSTSFAGGPGIGLSWELNRNFYVFASGDKIYGSFSFADPVAGSSAHRTSNARAAFGIAYRF